MEGRGKSGKVGRVERRKVDRDPNLEHVRDRSDLVFNLAQSWPASTGGDVIPLCGND